MLNGLLSDRRKLQAGNEKRENASTNARGSAVIQRRHTEGGEGGGGGAALETVAGCDSMSPVWLVRAYWRGGELEGYCNSVA